MNHFTRQAFKIGCTSGGSVTIGRPRIEGDDGLEIDERAAA